MFIKFKRFGTEHTAFVAAARVVSIEQTEEEGKTEVSVLDGSDTGLVTYWAAEKAEVLAAQTAEVLGYQEGKTPAFAGERA